MLSAFIASSDSAARTHIAYCRRQRRSQSVCNAMQMRPSSRRKRYNRTCNAYTAATCTNCAPTLAREYKNSDVRPAPNVHRRRCHCRDESHATQSCGDSSTQEFDVLVIGAGAFGAAAARDAALRGLRTALIERADFGGATSAECFKMVHGGIRYLQHADVPRLRASSHERSALAAHCTAPGAAAADRHSRPTVTVAAAARSSRPARRLTTCSRWIATAASATASDRSVAAACSRARDLLELFPHLSAPDLSGAVVFEDGQMYNPARLVLAFVSSAVDAGATACNYVEATKFLWRDSAVCGVRARDRLSGDEFDVRARLTLNAAGPWADYLQNDSQHFGAWRRLPFSRDAYFIVDRAPTSEYGVAVQGLSRDKDAVLGRATRHLFAVPWRDKTLIGVWHTLFPDFPDGAHVRAGRDRDLDRRAEQRVPGAAAVARPRSASRTAGWCRSARRRRQRS